MKEEVLQLILKELQQQTKLMQYQTKLFEDFIMRGADGDSKAVKREEMKQQLNTVMTAMFKGTPMETKMQDVMKNISTLL